MHEPLKETKLGQLIEELNTTVKRIGQLTKIMMQSHLRIDLTGLNPEIIGSMRQLLEALADDADLLEGLVETLLPDQYLEWLFSVPADSKVFDYRRKYSDQGEEERFN